MFGNAGGGKISPDEYLRAHAELLARDRWFIDGFGCVKSAWEHFASVLQAAASKRVHHLRSAAEIGAF